MGKMGYLQVFFGYIDSLETLSDEQFGRVIRAALMYARDGVVPEFEALEALAFGFLRGDIDRAKANYDALCEINKENGKKGGRPKQEQETERLNENRTVSEKTDRNRKNPYKTKQNKTIQNNLPSGEDTRTRARTHAQGNDGSSGEDGEAFVAPTVEDVRQYCKEAGITLDADRFVTHYESMKWTINGKTLPDWDWKARARKWAKEDAERAAQQPQPVTSFDSDEFFAAALERSYGEPVQIPKGNG
ncbi:MAG: DUF6291 domain-containing protein [Clostridiales bacterium]|nr:DUF6291 domain-containing protein [Clostridiales bacterium]